MDPGRPQAAGPWHTAPRASWSGSPAAARGSRVLQRRRAPRGLSPGRAPRGPSGLPSARPAPAEPGVFYRRRARDVAEESGTLRARLDAGRSCDPPPATPSQSPPTRAHRRPYLTCDAPRLPAHRPDRLCTPEVTSAGGPAPAPGGRCGFPGRSPPSPRAGWAAAAKLGVSSMLQNLAGTLLEGSVASSWIYH